MLSFPCLLFLTAPVIYFSLEYFTSLATTPPYSYIRHHTSFLAYPYPFQDKDTGLPTRSPRAYWMKANFILNGTFYQLGQQHYIDCHLTSTRISLACLYCVGLTLVALDSGDTGTPRGEKKQSLWHGLGAAVAILAGNVGSVLAGFASDDVVYGIVSAMLGIGGLVGAVCSGLYVEGEWRGLWQRSAIYPIAVWMGFTGIVLAMNG